MGHVNVGMHVYVGWGGDGVVTYLSGNIGGVPFGRHVVVSFSITLSKLLPQVQELFTLDLYNKNFIGVPYDSFE